MASAAGFTRSQWTIRAVLITMNTPLVMVKTASGAWLR